MYEHEIQAVSEPLIHRRAVKGLMAKFLNATMPPRPQARLRLATTCGRGEPEACFPNSQFGVRVFDAVAGNDGHDLPALAGALP